MNFKEIYNQYMNQPDEKSENLLLRAICYDTKFGVGYIKENGINIIRPEKYNENKSFLNIYTDINEVNDEEKEKYNGIIECDFEEILEYVNKTLANGVQINPNTDNFKITNCDLMALKRQMKLSDASDTFKLCDDTDFIKPAYKIAELNTTSNKLIETYNKYLKDNNKETLNEFYKILVNEATFYSLVLPKENAEKDEEGHPLISKNRVLQNRISETSANYYLFISIKKMIEFIDANENSYVSIFNFDDYMTLIDSNWNRIESLSIIGDLDLTIPVDVLNELKFFHDGYKNERVKIRLVNKLDKSEITLKIRKK